MKVSLTNTLNSIVIALEGRILSDLDLDAIKEQTSQLAVWNIVFDLSGLTHTNSSGIAFIIKTMTRARINNGDVVLANPNEGIKKLIDIKEIDTDNLIIKFNKSKKDLIKNSKEYSYFFNDKHTITFELIF